MSLRSIVGVSTKLLLPWATLEWRAGCAERCKSGSERRGRETVYRALPLTLLPMAKGFLYLVAVIDWYSRKVLAWELSNSMDVRFCVEALETALRTYGAPEIFNTDQGSQFTSEAFTSTLKAHEIRISMDGKGRWVDNVFVERLWRSLKYEEVYLRGYSDVAEARRSISNYFEFFNRERMHQSLNRQTPDQVYYKLADQRMAA